MDRCIKDCGRLVPNGETDTCDPCFLHAVAFNLDEEGAHDDAARLHAIAAHLTTTRKDTPR